MEENLPSINHLPINICLSSISLPTCVVIYTYLYLYIYLYLTKFYKYPLKVLKVSGNCPKGMAQMEK